MWKYQTYIYAISMKNRTPVINVKQIGKILLCRNDSSITKKLNLWIHIIIHKQNAYSIFFIVLNNLCVRINKPNQAEAANFQKAKK